MQVVFDNAYELLRREPPLIKDFERGVDDQNVKQDVMVLQEEGAELKELMKLKPKFEGMVDVDIIDLVARAEMTASPRPS